MILMLTDRFDVHADRVVDLARARCLEFVRFDLDVESLRFSTTTFDGNMWEVRTPESCFELSDVSCVWCRRPFVELTLQEQQNREIDFKIWKNEWNSTLLGMWTFIRDVPWLNPLRKAYRGENKFLQRELATRIGFAVPSILVSNDKRKIVDFCRSNNKTIFKLTAQDIYETKDGEFVGMYTNQVSVENLERFSDCGENPLLLQNYIEKQYEVRYTVVGERHFACRIDSQASQKAALDWRRYDLPNTPHTAIEAPPKIRAMVCVLMKELGIEYGAIDFIVTPQDEWCFLEINCMGQWLWIEDLTGLQISTAITDWLESHVPSNPRRTKAQEVV